MNWMSNKGCLRLQNANIITTKKNHAITVLGILQDTWPVLSKTVKVTANKEKLRDCHRPEETGNEMTKWCRVPCMGS